MTTAPANGPAGASPTSAPIFCGVAGWSYPDWEGYVYPRGTKDKLRFVAGFVDAIEINSTFYRPPDPKTVSGWLRRTEDLPRFFFTAKLHQDVTHRGQLEEAMVGAFRRGFEPALQERKLKHLLAQFRYDFEDTPATRDYLRRLRDAFGPLANLTLELRHCSWQRPEALEFLKTLGVTVAHLDYPGQHSGFGLRLCPVGQHAYFRLHGRNAKAWFSKDAGRDETYNYLYSAAELDQIVKRAAAIAAMSKSLTLVANNHYQGKEAVNILQIKAKLTGVRVDVPPLLLQHYPDLAKIASQRPE